MRDLRSSSEIDTTGNRAEDDRSNLMLSKQICG